MAEEQVGSIQRAQSGTQQIIEDTASAIEQGTMTALLQEISGGSAAGVGFWRTRAEKGEFHWLTSGGGVAAGAPRVSAFSLPPSLAIIAA